MSSRRRLRRLQVLALASASILVPLVASPADAVKAPLDAPSAAVVSGVTSTSLDLSWQAASSSWGTVRYSVFLNGAPISTGLRSSTYSFTGLRCATTYTLGVSATSTGGRQSPITSVDGSTSGCAPVANTTPPSPPASVHVTATTSTSVSAGWTATTDTAGIVGYGVYLAGKLATSVTGTTYTAAGLTCGTTVSIGVDAVDAAGLRSGVVTTSGSTAPCTAAPPPPPPAPTAPAADLFVSPSGSDANPCTQAAPCANLNAAYQLAAAGSVVQVAAGTYPYQRIDAKASLRNLSPGCTPAATAQCVHFVGSGVKINGQVEIHGSDVWLDGGTSTSSAGFDVGGRIDTEADSDSVYPDHVIVQGTHSTSLSIFNTDTATFRWMDVGPATVSTGCAVLQGAGGENMIGFADGVSFVPRNLTLDGVKIHDQNGDSGRIASDCHWGGLFLVTANGLTVKNSTFEKNVVYNVEIQNFVGPPATNVTFVNNAFGCPVDWLYNGAPCDGQSSIQFDGTFPGISITGNAFADGVGWWGQGFGCYRSPCDFSGDTMTGNTFADRSTTAPPLPVQP